jgi:hypothetical protein
MCWARNDVSECDNVLPGQGYGRTQGSDDRWVWSNGGLMINSGKAKKFERWTWPRAISCTTNLIWDHPVLNQRPCRKNAALNVEFPNVNVGGGYIYHRAANSAIQLALFVTGVHGTVEWYEFWLVTKCPGTREVYQHFQISRAHDLYLLNYVSINTQALSPLFFCILSGLWDYYKILAVSHVVGNVSKNRQTVVIPAS